MGTGFSEKALRDLKSRMDEIASDRRPFASDNDIPRGAHWVHPELVCEVAFGEWTRDNKIRHSVFHGLRDDKRN